MRGKRKLPDMAEAPPTSRLPQQPDPPEKPLAIPLVQARPPSSAELVLEKEDFLFLILRHVASRTGKYDHALVCRRWAALAPSAQSAVHVVPRGSTSSPVPERELVQQIRDFSSLTRLRLSARAVPRITDFFLGSLACAFRKLRHLELESRVSWAQDDTTGEGWSSLFATNPGLLTLTYSGIRKAMIIDSLTILTRLRCFRAEEVASLPPSLGSLSHLRSLSILGNWDCTTELPPSVSQLKRLRDLTFHSGSLQPVPDEVSGLCRLTTLRLQLYRALSLPESLGRLPRLRELELTVCLELAELPDSLENLRNLRRIKLACCPRLRHVPAPTLLLEKVEIRDCPRIGLAD